jgi:spore coat polysaccharide biosynthesis protein SpsF
MILAILTAPTDCVRTTGGAMAPVLGEPMIWRQIERIRHARSLSKLVVILAQGASGDPLACLLLSRGVEVRRTAGSDLLAAAAAAAAEWSPAHVALLSADCPLIDPHSLDVAAGLAAAAGAVLTHGPGLELVSTEALITAAAEATEAADRADPARYLRRRSARFPQAALPAAPDHRLSAPGETARIRRVFEALLPIDPDFGPDEAEAVFSMMGAEGVRAA